jgi:hypothetical protein
LAFALRLFGLSCFEFGFVKEPVGWDGLQGQGVGVGAGRKGRGGRGGGGAAVCFAFLCFVSWFCFCFCPPLIVVYDRRDGCWAGGGPGNRGGPVRGFEGCAALGS